jgi:hypothetical protein
MHLSSIGSSFVSLATEPQLLFFQDDPAVGGESSERAQHVQSGQRRRLRHVQEVEGLEGERQGVREHYQVS